MNENHYRKLERMYLKANINQSFFESTAIEITHQKTEINLNVTEKYWHALGAMHGAVYFKLLDDSAYFAANSIVTDVFLLTASFTINFLRPVKTGKLTAFGQLKHAGKELLVAESKLFDQRGREIGFGTGNFAKSKVILTEEIGYI